MESCIVILQKNKKPKRKNKILFIDALNQVERHDHQNYLSTQNIKLISDIFNNFKNVEGISHVANLDDVKKEYFSLHIRNYVLPKLILDLRKTNLPLKKTIFNWEKSSQKLRKYFIEIKNDFRMELKID